MASGITKISSICLFLWLLFWKLNNLKIFINPCLSYPFSGLCKLKNLCPVIYLSVFSCFISNGVLFFFSFSLPVEVNEGFFFSWGGFDFIDSISTWQHLSMPITEFFFLADHLLCHYCHNKQ